MGSLPGISGRTQPTSLSNDASIVKFIDRWMFVIMAGLFFVTALTGFIPSSMLYLEGVEAGRRPPIPPVLHVHAVLMGSWLTLLLVQSTLMATGRSALHKTLGMVAFVHVPAIVITGVFVIKVYVEQHYARHAGMSAPEIAADIDNTMALVIFLMREGSLFLLFMGWALSVRRKDPQLHKRLIILATVLPMTAAFARHAVVWQNQNFGLYNELYWDLCCVLWILPMFLWDLYRSGTVHRAYRIWFPVFVVTAIPVHMLRTTEWWNATAERMMGVAA